MSRKIPAEQTFALSRALHRLAAALGDFRYEHWDELTPGRRQELENKEWTILNAASDLNARSVMMKTKLLEKDLKTLSRTTRKIRAASRKIDNVRRGIDIAARAIAFSGAISTGNVAVTLAAARELTAAIDAV